MKTLYLLRHAKSSWKDSSTADFDRPLAPRGQKAAEKMAAFLAANGLQPDLILCSAAKRARQTLAPIQAAFNWRIPTQLTRWPYDGGVPELYAYLDKTPPRINALMIIAHQPSMQAAALELTAETEDSARSDLAAKFPTCALAEIRFNARSWKSCKPGRGRLARFIKVKSLV